jgi:hypothetical protein
VSAFAIFRAAKLKSVGALLGSADHNSRERETLNADPARRHQNRQLIGFLAIPTKEQLLIEWERRTAHAQRKADAVLVEELFLGVSPGFFSGTSSDTERSKQLEAWLAASCQWLRDEFGDLVLSATLHADETTPHVCAYIVPLRRAKDGTVWLSAKHLFNPRTLTAQQDRYAAAVAHLGLRRGVRGSKAKHTSLREFYGRLSEAENITAKQVATAGKSTAEGIEDETTRLHLQLARTTQRNLELLAKNTALKTQLDLAARNTETSRKTATDIGRINENMKSKIAELAGQVRDIPLTEVMERFGYAEPAKEGSSLVYRTGSHAIAVSGVKWFDHQAGKGGGKAIDLVMHLESCDFATAVGWLAGHWTPSVAAAAVSAAAREIVSVVPKRTFADHYRYYAAFDPDTTRAAVRYLTETRHLDSELVRRAIALRLLHGSIDGRARRWCVFHHLDADGKIRGASLRALDSDEGGKRAIGSKTEGYFAIGPSRNPPSEIALVESPIDALAYHQLHPTSRAVSMAGANIPTEFLNTLTSDPTPVVVALDHDPAGERGWQHLVERLKAFSAAFVARFCRVLPAFGTWPVKDWADVIRSRYIATKEAPPLPAPKFNRRLPFPPK